MADGAVRIFAQETAKPGDPFPFDDVVCVDSRIEIREVGDMTAHDDRRVRQVLADKLTHLPDLEPVRDDAADPDNIVVLVADLLDEAIQAGKIQQRAGRVDVGLDEHQAPRTMELPQREGTLDPGHLVVIQLHRVQGPAAVFIVLGIGPEDACQQDAGSRSGGMTRDRLGRDCRNLRAGYTHGASAPDFWKRVLRRDDPRRSRA